ncbi:putative histone-lysine N-methyltransferase ASHH3-like isoform X2 [Capsicum annuum]|nr:putative histone-lysine N-methyltransferase ASHH3-like isoform X2 [Capsicum annuum]KAF3667652.1 putative histone-lysine N-methyltransferase ASHH3-like isoform X2 [Capsicum annuum]
MPIFFCGQTVVHGGIGHVFSKLIKEIGDPVDFELPDWLNKWQSMPYIFIRRNIYLIKKVKRRLEDDGIFCSCRSTGETSAVCGKDCLCGLGGLVGQLPGTCNWWKMTVCQNQYVFVNLTLAENFLILLAKLEWNKTEKCGSGIVADEDIKRGDFVIEYVGEVIDDKTCEERLWKMKHSGETNFYLCEINRDMVIDATYKGNKSRYINHSCCPNTEMQKWVAVCYSSQSINSYRRKPSRNVHCLFESNKYSRFVQFGADQDCHCGAVGCRRKLGVKPNKPKLPASDAALKIVACQVAATSPKLKALLSTRHVYQTGVPPIGTLILFATDMIFALVTLVYLPSNLDPLYLGCSGYDPDLEQRRPRNCIGQVIRIIGSSDTRSFGIVQRFDAITKKHLIMFEDGCVQYLDLSKEDWEFYYVGLTVVVQQVVAVRIGDAQDSTSVRIEDISCPA